MVSVWPAALTHGPAPPPIDVPSTDLIAGVVSGYSQSGRLYLSAKAMVGTTGVSRYAVWPGMNGHS